MSLRQTLQALGFIPCIIYGMCYTNSNWDSNLWGGRKSSETILPDIYTMGQAQLAFFLLIPQSSSPLGKQLSSEQQSRNSSSLARLLYSKCQILCKWLESVDVYQSVKVWVSLENKLENESLDSKLHCESWGQRFGPLVWYSQIGKLVHVIKNEV